MNPSHNPSHNHGPTKKYRPSLRAELIDHALALAKKEQPISDLSIDLIGALAPFSAKIANGSILPASVVSPKESIEESLGLVDVTLYNNDMITKEDYWNRCYELYVDSPELCTLQEIKAAQEHMYLNDLMSEAELAAFEKRAETEGDTPKNG